MKQKEFWKVLLLGSPEMLGAFLVGLIVTGLIADLIYDLLTLPSQPLLSTLLVVGTTLFLTLVAYLFYRLHRRRVRVQAEVDEGRLAPPHAGLIWLFGPGRFDHLLFALEHHQKGNGAAHCWLVMQNTQQVKQAFAQLQQQLLERGLTTQLYPVYVQEPDVQAVYQAVRTVLEREAIEEGLTAEQVIADITSGTKPMTAGMVLAALTTGSDLEYVESDRDQQGQPIRGTLRVVLVDTFFYLTRGGD